VGILISISPALDFNYNHPEHTEEFEKPSIWSAEACCTEDNFENFECCTVVGGHTPNTYQNLKEIQKWLMLLRPA
jgi:hypothetical protein